MLYTPGATKRWSNMGSSEILVSEERIRYMTLAEYAEFRTGYGSIRGRNGLNYEICRKNWALTGEIKWLDKMLEYVND